MKRLILYALAASLFAACHNNNNKNDGNNDNDEQAEKAPEKKTSKRDYSINNSNSYTDIFLDSVTVENYIASKKLNDTISRRIRSFYNTRNYQFAWFSGDGPTEQGRSFWNLHQYYTTYGGDTTLNDKALRKKVNYIMSEEAIKISATDKSMVNNEITLTEHFIRYMLTNYKQGEIKRKEMERFVPFKKEEAMYLADSLLTKKHKDNKYYADVNPAYKMLKDQLQKYYDIQKRGGWGSITTSRKTLKKGITAPEILALKKRLEKTGEMAPGDTTQLFDDQLFQAVQAFQKSRGLTPTGIVNTSLVKEMNVPALKRVEQILINM